MPDVRDALERIATQVAPEPDGFRRVQTRRKRVERNRRLAAAALAFVVAAAGIATAAALVSHKPIPPTVPSQRLSHVMPLWPQSEQMRACCSTASGTATYVVRRFLGWSHPIYEPRGPQSGVVHDGCQSCRSVAVDLEPPHGPFQPNWGVVALQGVRLDVAIPWGTVVSPRTTIHAHVSLPDGTPVVTGFAYRPACIPTIRASQSTTVRDHAVDISVGYDPAGNRCEHIEARGTDDGYVFVSQAPTGRSPDPFADLSAKNSATAPIDFAAVAVHFGPATSTVPGTPTPMPTPAQPRPPLELATLHMITATDGWATSIDNDSGRVSVLVTSDGSTTWRDVTPHGLTGDQSGVTAFFLDTVHAWVAWPRFEGVADIASVTVYRTNDGGQSWSHSSFTSRPSFDGSLQFVDPLHGWAVATISAAAGNDPVEVWRTNDGGVTWAPVSRSASSIPGVPPGTPNALPPCGASAMFVDGLTGFAVAPCVAGSELLVTHDGGASWSKLEVTPPFGIVGGPDRPTFTSATDGYISFLAPQGAGVTRIYATRDGGRTWSLLPLPEKLVTAVPAFLGPDRVWTFGNDPSVANIRTFVTSDGGAHWASYPTNVNLAGSQMQFVDPLHGWAISRVRQEPFLFRTDDGGRTWHRVRPAYGS